MPCRFAGLVRVESSDGQTTPGYRGSRLVPMDYDLDGARIAMAATTNKRCHDRTPMPLEVHFSYGRVEGVGELANISYSGALIEDTVVRPTIGTPTVLYVYLKPPRAFEAEIPSELVGVVIRHSSDGFAVKFEDNLDPDVREMVDNAAALVTVSR